MSLAGATLIFALTYLLIVSERTHRTVAALLGAAAMVLFQIVDQETAFRAIDLNVILLLAGMMIIANVLRRTGVFQWTAVRAVRMSHADPFHLLVLLSLVTAVASAFLDNVTTVVLMVPVTLFIAARLDLDAAPFLIAEVLASNIGGTATLIGDPPNILIGSAAGLNYLDFLSNALPAAALILLAFLITARWLMVRGLAVDDERREEAMALGEDDLITDRPLLAKGLGVLGLTLVGFMLHGQLDTGVATIALAGASLLLLISRLDVPDVLHEVEWSTLLFFVGLFVVVAGVVEAGLIEHIADGMLAVTGGGLTATTLGLLWLSGLLSGIIDNIPYTATMLPVVQQLGNEVEVRPLWWALALGAGLGGNLTIVAASANILAANLSARAGRVISFGNFFRYGAVVTLEAMVISSIYVWLRYLMW